MFKSFFSFCILSVTLFVFAAESSPSLTPQERFDRLSARKTFGEEELLELRAVMTEEAPGQEVDCTFCPDALTWDLVARGCFDEAAWLFDHKADHGIKDRNGMTLLQFVCRGGHREFAELLIRLGAEVNLPDQEGLTAIHYAAMSCNSELLDSLLRLGGDPNRLTKSKETPLHFAAQFSGLEEVQFLVEHGASIKAINWTLVENLKEQRRRQDKIYYDSDEEHLSTLKAALGLKTPESLESNDDEDEEDDEDDEDDGGERYADANASRSKNKGKTVSTISIDQIPLELLPRDVNDAANIKGLTVLHYAAAKGDTDVVRFLLEHGADIHAQDSDLSRSAIHFAAENGNIECIKLLAERGADLEDRDCYGATALHYAARSDKIDVIKFLVNRKIDYTAKDIRGWSSMHYAASGGSLDAIRYLITKGLNINELNETGRTPLFFVGNNREVREFMISNGAK